MCVCVRARARACVRACVRACDPIWCQVCFREAGVGSQFVRTGVAVLVQMDVLGVTVNGIRPNGGTRTAMPRAPGSSLSWSRELADVGYREVIQMSGPEAFYSFEDVYVDSLVDKHCLRCSAGERMLDGAVSGAKRGLSDKAGLGTGKYLVLDGVSSLPIVNHSLTLPSKAVSIAWLMKPRPCLVEEVCSEAILYPLGARQGEFDEGMLAITFRKRPGLGSDGITLSQDRVLQLQLVGCQDQEQNPVSDTIVFDYAFEDIRWYTVVISVDVSPSGDGVAVSSRVKCSMKDGEREWLLTFTHLLCSASTLTET